MKDYTSTSWICMALMRIGTRMATGFDQHFAALKLTQAQFRILLAVWEEGGKEGIAPSVLADYLLIERGTVTVLTTPMVKRGWLERQPGENRRTYRLTLTTAGRTMLEEAVPRAVVLADETLSAIPAEQLDLLRVHLEQIEAQLRDQFQS